jgi:N-acetylglucosamine-6-sulfatase
MSCGLTRLYPDPVVRLAAVTLLALSIAAASVAPDARTAQHRPSPRPNVVFILTDDLSSDLIQYMPNVQQMQREGMTFSNYFVTDSLCCPSRASIFSGRYPHNHGVLTNTPPTGGFSAFRRGAEAETFATVLQGQGYRTALMGKYLNGYQAQEHYVPPGWSNFQGSGTGYRGFNYTLSANGRVAHFGRSSRAYLTDVLRRRGKSFVSRVGRSGHPFLLELATFAPHRPATPAPRDRHGFPFIEAPRDAAFDAVPENAPRWLRGRPPLSEEQIAAMNREYRKRAQSVQAVDDLVGQVRRTLRERGLDRDTYVIFSSDNGYHMGQRRLLAGKMTAYDSDIRVPLIVVGPGVPPGSTMPALAENVDLAPTLMRLAGKTPPPWVDGHGLVSLFRGQVPQVWRDSVLIEHHHPDTPSGDPDAQTLSSGNPPSYEAVRTATELYVEYVDGEREWYDLTTDPDQLHNRYDELTQDARDALHNRLVELEACSGAGCRRASVP